MSVSYARFHRLAAASAGAVALLVSCAKSDATGREEEAHEVVVPPAVEEAGTDASLSDAGPDDASDVTDFAPLPPVQECTATAPCPIEVPAPIPRTRNLVAIAGSGPDDVWAVGASSTVLHFDGTAWSSPATWQGAASGQNTLGGIWLSRRDDVWFMDGSDLVHSTGWRGPTGTTFERQEDALSKASEIPGLLSRPTDLGGPANGAAWNVARGELGFANVLVHWSPWSEEGPTGVDTVILNYDDGFLRAVSVPDANTVWAAGDRGKVFRALRVMPDAGGNLPPWQKWQIEEWNSHSTTALSDVYARGDEVWLIGNSGLVRRLGVDADGLRRFLTVETGSTVDLRAVHVFSPNDVWIVGDLATILHFDGTSWWRVPTPFDRDAKRPTLRAVWGADASDVWFVGEGTTLRLQRSGEKK
ncbi:MAG: hypothetical protein BGO98_25760 [Myxococcales bacterium 68-20]|nr:hypothetical protein [Myxococcales bacterium]OJY16053.1 MAG: hypothetical protein BGO98_25760 [Myxococcales bacterium 68-20]